jgi:hypothetical protein
VATQNARPRFDGGARRDHPIGRALEVLNVSCHWLIFSPLNSLTGREKKGNCQKYHRVFI